MLDAVLLSKHTRLILDAGSAKAKGTAGEKLVETMLNNRGYSARKAAGRHKGDLEVIDLTTGELLRVEVKTSTANKRGKYGFNLKKHDRYGSTDCKYSDILVLLTVTRSGACCLFVFEASELNQRQITISGNPFHYSGRYVGKRQYFPKIELRKNVRIS